VRPFRVTGQWLVPKVRKSVADGPKQFCALSAGFPVPFKYDSWRMQCQCFRGALQNQILRAFDVDFDEIYPIQF
jgi:hypothetical protein